MENLVNKLTLGTVQFGLEYGINNTKGKPSRAESLAMLDFACKKGIRVFDTAYAYGEAEEILGELLPNAGGKKIKIVTKLKPNILSEFRGKIYDIIAANLKESLTRLKIDQVDGYLLHTPEYIRQDEIVSAFCNLKKQGLVKNIGVSIYEESDALYAAGLKEVDYIQIPYGIFDQRMDKTDFFRLTKKNHITVFARSAFLQGLFFMPEKRMPAYLGKARSYLRQMDKIINQYGFSRAEAALMFSLKNKNIDYVVFGVDNMRQLREDIEIAQKNINCDDCIRELKNRFVDVEKSIILPSLWKK